jgi:AcrR family transcriptional regulator
MPVVTNKTEDPKRPYELGKRLEQMDQSRAAILRAARAQLEANGYRQFTMASLAAESGVTRQTIHNLFGTKAGVLGALFDLIALDGGMQNMREVMTADSMETMLRRFVEVFSHFWATNQLLIRRVHGIAAIDLEFGSVIEERNRRRLAAATRIVSRFGIQKEAQQRAATLAALTSFEFFDAHAGIIDEKQFVAITLDLARKLLTEA